MSDVGGVNPNVDTASTVENQETIEVRGGENLTSFDDLGRAVANKKAKPRQDATRNEDEEEPAKKEPKKEKKKEKEEDDETPTIAQAAEKKKAEQAEKARVKKILAKLRKEDGEEDVELDPGLMLKHKVGGKDIDVPLSELLNEFSGKTDWTRKYTDLDKERKEFTQSREQFNGNIRKFHELSKQNPEDAMEFIFDLYGHDSRAVLKGLQEKWLEKYSSYSEMDETERRAAQAEEEKSYYQRKVEKFESEKQNKQRLAQVHQQVQAVQSQYGIDNQSFMNAYKELASSPEVAEATRRNPNFELTPEHVARYHQISTMRNAVESTIAEIRPDLATKMDQIHSEVEYIRNRNPDFTKEDITDILRQVYAPKAKKAASLKDRVTGQKEVAKEIKSVKRPPVSFDDLL